MARSTTHIQSLATDILTRFIDLGKSLVTEESRHKLQPMLTPQEDQLYQAFVQNAESGVEHLREIFRILTEQEQIDKNILAFINLQIDFFLKLEQLDFADKDLIKKIDAVSQTYKQKFATALDKYYAANAHQPFGDTENWLIENLQLQNAQIIKDFAQHATILHAQNNTLARAAYMQSCVSDCLKIIAVIAVVGAILVAVSNPVGAGVLAVGLTSLIMVAVASALAAVDLDRTGQDKKDVMKLKTSEYLTKNRATILHNSVQSLQNSTLIIGKICDILRGYIQANITEETINLNIPINKRTLVASDSARKVAGAAAEQLARDNTAAYNQLLGGLQFYADWIKKHDPAGNSQTHNDIADQLQALHLEQNAAVSAKHIDKLILEFALILAYADAIETTLQLPIFTWGSVIYANDYVKEIRTLTDQADSLLRLKHDAIGHTTIDKLQQIENAIQFKTRNLSPSGGEMF